uniref:non-specific serine/threonine protein kinase n=1 Tax=Rhodosorus marinus TaxID=101924 RepID=A0A7S0G3E1_9RHOD|mmetsp:Transcript_15505/g.22732  ORF Transcript_15505/g.22732 Transcript_15505/m.22732 type:complete len:539 (+) Transcript_15505:139-1755(+)
MGFVTGGGVSTVGVRRRAESRRVPTWRSVMGRRRASVLSMATALGKGKTLKERYVLSEELGRGSTSVTFSAVDRASGHDVVVKALALRGLQSWKTLELFERESKALAALDHVSIPSYVDSFQEDTKDDRMFFLVQERAPGKSLSTLLEENWRATPTQVEDVLRQLLGVLDYLQALSPPVVHRDIKPSNVMIDARNGIRLFLVDFGGVVEGSRGIEGKGSTMIGTFGYMAPEQFTGAATAATDLYGVGATMIHLLTGREPGELPRSRLRVDFKSEAEQRYLSSSILSRVIEVVVQLTEPAPEDRFRTAREALDTLRGAPQTGRTQPAFWNQLMSQVKDQADLAVEVAVEAPPKGSKLIVERDEDRLAITVPSEGVTAGTVSNGMFSLTWNGIVGAFTWSALTVGSLPAAAFSIPFWLVGGQLLKRAAKNVTEESIFCTDRKTRRVFVILRSFGRESIQMLETRQIQDIRVAVIQYVNGNPVYCLEIIEGVKTFQFGQGMKEGDLLFIQSQLCNFTGKGIPGRTRRPTPMDVKRKTEDEF